MEVSLSAVGREPRGPQKSSVMKVVLGLKDVVVEEQESLN